MGFWAFVGIIVAVALGVYFGLKMYNDPEGFKADLSSIGALIELLLIFAVIVVLIGGVGFTVRYLIKNGFPQWVDGVIQAIGYILMVIFIFGILGLIIRSIVRKIKEKGGLKKMLSKKEIKKRWKEHKPKKEVVKKKVKNTTKGCLKYTGIIIGGSILFLLGMGLIIFLLAKL